MKVKLLSLAVMATLCQQAISAPTAYFEIEQVRPRFAALNQEIIVRFNLIQTPSTAPKPTGTITAVAGAASCTVAATAIPLSCTMRKVTSGIPRLTATYSGDNTYAALTAFQWSLPTPSYSIERVSGTSVVTGGFPAHQFYSNNTSFTNKALNRNGRKSTFSSVDRALHEKSNSNWQVYSTNSNSGATFLASMNLNGTPGNGTSTFAAIARDSGSIVFQSTSTNLLSSDLNGTAPDIFVSWNGQSTHAKISTTSSGAEVMGSSLFPDISDDGRFVVFQSSAKTLTNDSNQTQLFGVFLKDTLTEQTTLISNPGSEAEEPIISGDGRYIFYITTSAPYSTNGHYQIVKYTRATGLSEIISARSGIIGNSDSYNLTSNTDGSQIAFTSYASNLTQTLDPRAGLSDVFVWHASSNNITQVTASLSATDCSVYSQLSIADNGSILFAKSPIGSCGGSTVLWQANNGVLSTVFPYNYPFFPIKSNGTLSADGNYKLFSYQPPLAPLDTFADFDLILSGPSSNEYVSANTIAESNFDSEKPVISSLGRYVGYNSYASNLVPNDTNSYADYQSDIFVYDAQTGTTTRANQEINGSTGTCSFSYCSANIKGVSDLKEVLFSDTAEHGGSENNAEDIFLRSITGTFEKISVATNGTAGNGYSTDAEMNSAASMVVFSSDSSNLVAGDTANTSDIFLRNRGTGITSLISKKLNGTPLGSSAYPSITKNGDQYAFCSSEAMDANDSNGVSDCFTALPNALPVRVVGELGQLNAASGPVDIANSATTNRTVFVTSATNVKSSVLDLNAKTDAYLFIDGQIRLLTHIAGNANVSGDGDTMDAKLSPDGTKVIILSKATNLVAGDTNGVADVFVYDIASDTMNRITPFSGGTANSDVTGAASNGLKTVFATQSPFGSGDTNGWSDIYLAN
jgi:hypothetical protein